MKRKFVTLLLTLALGASLVSCSKDNNEESSTPSVEESTLVEMKSIEDESIGEVDTYIELGDSININGGGAQADNNKVNITSSGTYSISGTLKDGQIVVNAGDNDKVYIVLNGINITSSNSAPIYVKNADKTIISLADETENVVEDSTNYVFEDGSADEPSAVIFSKDDLTFIGNGSLTVKGNYNNGITSKDDLRIQSGNISVTAINTALRGKDSLTVKNGNITIDTQGDGMKANNDTDTSKGYIWIENGVFNITVGEDGIQAETELLINSGEFNIKTGGGSSNSSTSDNGNWGNWRMNDKGERPVFNDVQEEATEETASAKGIKATSKITIDNGSFDINSSDDSIHSNGELVINGGEIKISSGDDGVHADTSLVINAGNINISKSYEGIEGEKITLNDGNINVVASDDGINAAGGNDSSSLNGRPGQNGFGSNSSGEIKINGGTIKVDVKGDGIDSNGSIYITGGEVIVNGPTNNGNGSLDYDRNFDISGGTLIAVGSLGMAQGPSDSSTQKSVSIGVNNQQGNVEFKILSSSGEEIVKYTPTKQYSSIIVSSSKFKDGESYDLYIGNSKVQNFTISGSVTNVGSSNGGNMGMPGGGKGNRR